MEEKHQQKETTFHLSFLNQFFFSPLEFLIGKKRHFLILKVAENKEKWDHYKFYLKKFPVSKIKWEREEKKQRRKV